MEETTKTKTKTKTKKAEPKERKPNWREYTATVADIEEFLRDHVYLRHNVVTGRVECRIPESDLFADWIADGLPTDQWLPISDRIVNTLWRGLSKTKEVKTVNIRQVMESDFSPDYHPFRYYLERLPKWDGQDYLMELAMSVSVKGEVTEQLLFSQYLKKWLVAMVAAWVDPEVVNNVILVLIGEQGSYKTTWFTRLLPPPLQTYFRLKTNSSRMTKDDLLVLSEYGLVCCEELDTMRPSELNQLKAAVTMPAVDERRPYGHFTEHRRHIASFCGTGNNVQFLSDPTGNRRWLPFEIDSIDAPQDHPLNYEGIYSQAYALYQQGFRYWFSREEIQKLSVHNERFETARSELELIDQYFRKPVGDEPRKLVSATMAQQIIGGNIAHTLSKEKIGQAFNRLGFEYRRTSSQRGYVAVQRTGLEMDMYLRKLAEDTNPSMTDDSMTEIF